MNATKAKILSTLESLYGPCDHKKYFLVQSKTEQTVREEIINKLKEDGIIKDGNCTVLDLYVTTSQMNDDVFIQV